jgi:ADP-ribose pyrophosphatase YjhB (NUDIX family)
VTEVGTDLATGAAETGWVRVGAYAIVLDDADRLLLVRGASSSDGPGQWWMPGGGLDFGEDPADGVLRELAEETGFSGRIVELLGTVSMVYPTSVERPGEPVHVLGFVYRVASVGGALRDELEGSSDACAWLSRTDIVGLTLSATGRHAVALAWPDG